MNVLTVLSYGNKNFDVKIPFARAISRKQPLNKTSKMFSSFDIGYICLNVEFELKIIELTWYFFFVIDLVPASCKHVEYGGAVLIL